MNRMHMILVMMFSFCAAKAYAQQPDADASSTFEIPSEPLLQHAPAFAQWVITFSYSDEKGPGGASTVAKPIRENVAGRPRTITTTKTGNIVHEETVTVDGAKTEDWQVHGDFYIKFPGNSYWSAYDKYTPPSTSRDPSLAAPPPSGFRGLDWISKETYAEKTKKESEDCLVFVPGGRSALDLGDPSKQKDLDSIPKIAYIDAETRLPVMVRDAGVTRVFTFTQPAPAAMQTIPDDLAAEIKLGDEIHAKQAAAPLREY